MSHAQAERRDAVRGAILQYLDEHTRASDTVTGIRERWLTSRGVYEAPRLVEAVLEDLAAQGRIRASDLPDGTRVYGNVADGRET